MGTAVPGPLTSYEFVALARDMCRFKGRAGVLVGQGVEDDKGGGEDGYNFLQPFDGMIVLVPSSNSRALSSLCTFTLPVVQPALQGGC